MAENSSKFHVTWEKNDQKLSGTFTAENREAAEKFVKDNIPGAESVYARSYSGHLDERIRELAYKVKISENEGYQADKWNDVRKYEVEQRLRCSADMALMMGENTQESLLRVLERVVDCKWEITGLDGHMFSFGFKSTTGGFFGGIIFHCSAKEWSTHT